MVGGLLCVTLEIWFQSATTAAYWYYSSNSLQKVEKPNLWIFKKNLSLYPEQAAVILYVYSLRRKSIKQKSVGFFYFGKEPSLSYKWQDHSYKCDRFNLAHYFSAT